MRVAAGRVATTDPCTGRSAQLATHQLNWRYIDAARSTRTGRVLEGSADIVRSPRSRRSSATVRRSFYSGWHSVPEVEQSVQVCSVASASGDSTRSLEFLMTASLASVLQWECIRSLVLRPVIRALLRVAAGAPAGPPSSRAGPGNWMGALALKVALLSAYVYRLAEGLALSISCSITVRHPVGSGAAVRLAPLPPSSSSAWRKSIPFLTLSVALFSRSLSPHCLPCPRQPGPSRPRSVLTRRRRVHPRVHLIRDGACPVGRRVAPPIF